MTSLEKFQESLTEIGITYRLVSNLKFSLKERRRKRYTKERPVLFISLKDVDPEKISLLKKSYDDLHQGFVSFPIKERSKHLMVRYADQIYNFGYWPIPWVSQFRVWPSRMPQRATIETMVPTLTDEQKKLIQYINNIKKNKRRVLGGFHNEGFQQTNNTLVNNRAFKQGHNCSSWISTAPISKDNKAFLEELGGTREHLIGTNPGWWSAWLLSQAKRDIFAIYWDTLLIDEMLERIDQENFLIWDFKRM